MTTAEPSFTAGIRGPGHPRMIQSRFRKISPSWPGPFVFTGPRPCQTPFSTFFSLNHLGAGGQGPRIHWPLLAASRPSMAGADLVDFNRDGVVDALDSALLLDKRFSRLPKRGADSNGAGHQAVAPIQQMDKTLQHRDFSNLLRSTAFLAVSGLFGPLGASGWPFSKSACFRQYGGSIFQPRGQSVAEVCPSTVHPQRVKSCVVFIVTRSCTQNVRIVPYRSNCLRPAVP